MNIQRRIPVLAVAAVCLSFSGVAQAESIIVSVDSKAGPWDFNAGLNTARTYGIHDFTAPVVITSGFDFSSGRQLEITYLDGFTSPYGGVPPYADGLGDTGYAADDNPGSSGAYFPSRYFDSGDYPSYLNSLVGAFTDGSGEVVGTPFNIGLGRIVTVPEGASQLQLGINDDIFQDNTGALRVRITGLGDVPGAPDGGATLSLLCLGFMVCAVARRLQGSPTSINR